MAPIVKLTLIEGLCSGIKVQSLDCGMNRETKIAKYRKKRAGYEVRRSCDETCARKARQQGVEMGCRYLVQRLIVESDRNC